MNGNEEEQNELFDFEKLIVYQKAFAFRRLINPIVANPPRKTSDNIDHLDRSTRSMMLNIPEGNGYPFGSKTRRKHFLIALGSANEAASAWIELWACDHIADDLYRTGRSLLLEIVKMLSKMTR